MSGELILAIDQGTTNTKAIVVDAAGGVVAEASIRVPLSFPRPGWVESDARELWATVEGAIGACLRDLPGGAIAAIAIANQRESVLAWDRRTGEPLGPCISWQCRRTAPFCDELRAGGHEPAIRARTGLGIDPLFSASKVRWLLERIEDAPARARRGDLAVGTLDTWLVWNLTRGAAFATDHTNASRTQLLDLDRLAWDEVMLDLFGVPAGALAEIHPSSAIVGRTASGVAPGPGIPIAAMVGDSHAALMGHGAPAPGTVKATYGTGTSVMAPVERPVRANALSSTVAWSLGGAGGAEAGVVYALEGNIAVTGAAIEWLATVLGLDGQEAEIARLASSVPDPGGVVMVPAFVGLGAPHWDADARGLIVGITRGTTRAHLARAALEAIAYQVRDVIEVMTATLPDAVRELHADGGATRSDLLAQIQADALGLPVRRTRTGALAAMGAAYLAGLAAGIWRSVEEVRALPRGTDAFAPRRDAREHDSGYRAWQDAVRRAASMPAERSAAAGVET